MRILEKFRGLCRPAQFYAILSIFSLVSILVQNIMEPSRYCLGSYSCKLNFSRIFMFLAKALYMLMWTVILQSLCKNGYDSISWFIVLIPFVLMFVLLGLFMVSMQ